MNRPPIVAVVLWLASVAAAVVIARSQVQPADIILSNGKVVTVDDRFLDCVRGRDPWRAHRRRRHRPRRCRVRRHRDSAHRSRRPDRHPRTDRQPHAPAACRDDVAVRGARGTAWDRGGGDGPAARPRADGRRAGEWIYTLGGWAMEQFADDKTPFTRAELDRAAPGASGAAAGVVLPLAISTAAPCRRSASMRPTGVVGRAGHPRRWRRACRLPTARATGSRRAPGR